MMPPKKRTSTTMSAPGLARDPKKRRQENMSFPSVQDLRITEFSQKRCQAWFYEYAGRGKDSVVGPEAMEKFCEDLGVEPENIVMLVLAWKLQAKQMGSFTLCEWLCGMTNLQCDTMEKLKEKLNLLRDCLSDAACFKNIYLYAFDFAKQEDQRYLDVDIAKEMLQLLLGRTWSLYPYFNQFLHCVRHRTVNRDQWNSILEFSRVIKDDLSNYDEDGAWPVLLDEFVQWMRSQDPSLVPTARTFYSQTLDI